MFWICDENCSSFSCWRAVFLQCRGVFYFTQWNVVWHSAVPGWVGQLTQLSKRETLNFSLCSATKGRVELVVGSSITQGLSVHRSSCGEQLCCLSIAFFSPCWVFLFLFIYSHFLFFFCSFFFLLKSIYLYPCLILAFWSSPLPTVRGERVAVWGSAACVKLQQFSFLIWACEWDINETMAEFL